MAISYISQQAADANTLTMPTHEAGDLIIGFASREGNATPPTIPGGWTSIDSGGDADCSTSLAYKIAASSSETFGTWTNAVGVLAHVYRGAVGIGSDSEFNDGGTSIDYPALTLSVTDGSSWVALFAGHLWGGGATLNAPSGYQNRSNNAGATHGVGGHDSNTGVTTYAGGNGTLTGGGFDNYMARAVEILGSIPLFEQEGFRWRDDDGNETAATWLANQDTNISRDDDTNTRLRTLINTTLDTDAAQHQLEYRKSGDSEWHKITTQ